MPPKKKVAGDAGKGEKLFKNLCAQCHSHTVSIPIYKYTKLQSNELIQFDMGHSVYLVMIYIFALDVLMFYFRVTVLVPTLLEL